MADIKARRVLGGSHTAADTLEVQFTYTGDAHSCVQYLESISGPGVTHGGGAAADSKLHYKAHLRDDGSTDEVDGVIDYSSSEMYLVQSAQGTSVVKVVADILLKSEVDAYQTEYDAWYDAYVVQPEGEVMSVVDGAPNPPVSPTPTTYKSGEITLEWADDTFV